jgi:hypothetical protein
LQLLIRSEVELPEELTAAYATSRRMVLRTVATYRSGSRPSDVENTRNRGPLRVPENTRHR